MEVLFAKFAGAKSVIYLNRSNLTDAFIEKFANFLRNATFYFFFLGETYLSGEKCRVNLFFYLYLFFDAICTV